MLPVFRVRTECCLSNSWAVSRGAKGTVDSSCNVIEISELLLCDCSEYLMFNVTVLFLRRIASQKASVNTSHLIQMWKVKLKWMRS